MKIATFTIRTEALLECRRGDLREAIRLEFTMHDDDGYYWQLEGYRTQAMLVPQGQVFDTFDAAYADGREFAIRWAALREEEMHYEYWHYAIRSAA